MMAAITWRNVNGPSLAEASRPLEAAQRTISGSFDSLNNLLNRQETIDASNWDQIKQNNTQAFMDKLYSAQGADGFKRMQDSGELQRMLGQYGAQIDRAAARGAMDGRLATLQQRDVANINYNNTMTDTAQADDVRRISMLTLTDPNAAAAELAARPDLRAAVQLAQGIDSRRQTLVDRSRADTRFGWDTADAAFKEQKRPLEIDKLNDELKDGPARRALQAAQADALKAQAAASRAEAERKLAENSPSALADKRFEEFVKNSPLDKGTIDTAEGKKALFEGLKNLGLNDSQKSDILFNLNKYYSQGVAVGTDSKGKPIRLPLPVSVVLDAVQGSTENPIASIVPGWSRRGDDVANIIDRRFGVFDDGTPNPAYRDSRDRELIDTMQAIQAIRNARSNVLATNPAGVRGGGR